MSAEDDELFERLRQAESRRIQHVSEALDRALAHTRTAPDGAPSPLDWHPAYADKTGLVDWLNGVGPYGDRYEILLAKPRPLRFELGRAIAGESTIEYLPDSIGDEP